MKALILIGPSGSGKSTFAKEFLRVNKDYIRINRDDIRRTLVADLEGYYQRKDLKYLEEMVSCIEIYTYQQAILYEKNLLFDNTNLNKKYLENLLKDLYSEKIEYEFKIFEEEINECKLRVHMRDDIENTSYIDKQFKQFTEIKKYINDTISTTSV